MHTMSNSTGTGDKVDHETWPTPFGVFVTVLMTLTVILNLALNPLMLLTLARATGIKQTTKIFLASLTLSDLLTGIFVIPRLLELYAGAWLLGEFLCAAVGVVVNTFYSLGVASLLLLTINRYLAVSHPLRYPTLVTPRRSKIAVCIVWASFSIGLILLFGIYDPSVVLPQHPRICTYTKQEWRVFIAGFFIALVLIVVIILYVRIYLIARRHARHIAAAHRAGGGGHGNGKTEPQPFHARATTTIAVITGTLILTWIPTIVASFVQPSGLQIYPAYQIVYFTDSLMLSNSWLNVVIYYLRNRDLRRALYGFLLAGRRCS